jgi:hypothetical protein
MDRLVGIAAITQVLACSLVTPLDDLGPADAAVDAATDAPVFACAAQSPAPIFCDDFDEHPLGTGWTAQSVTVGALMLTPQPALSQPNALHSACPARDAGTCAARLSVDLASTALRFDVDFDIYLEDDAAGTTIPNSAGVAELQFTTDAGVGYQVDMRCDGQILNVNDTGSSTQASSSPGFYAIGAWTHVHVTVDFVTSQLTIAANKTTVIAKPLATGAKAGSPRLLLGVATDNPAQSIWDYDNVLIR